MKFCKKLKKEIKKLIKQDAKSLANEIDCDITGATVTDRELSTMEDSIHQMQKKRVKDLLQKSERQRK